MDCIIRVIKGADAGLTHRILSGGTLIGRSSNAGVRLTSLDVSYEHAVITRSGDEYYLENLSAAGTYLGDSKVGGSIKLRPRDVIRLSPDTVLRLETPEGESNLLLRRVLIALVVLGVAGLAFVMFSGIGSSGGEDNWEAAHAKLDSWVQGEVKAKRLPAAAAQLFRDAWRLESIQDYTRSQELWMKLRALLDTITRNTGDRKAVSLSELSAERALALQNLLTPPKNAIGEPTEEDLAAALVQFVQRRFDWSGKQIKPSGFAP